MSRHFLRATAIASTALIIAACSLSGLPGTAHAQEILADPGYEGGYPTGPGTTYTGGPAGSTNTWTSAGSSGSATVMPTDWMVDGTGNPANESQWVQSAGNGAGGSDHFLYIPSGNDLCIEPLFSSMSTGLQAGSTYCFSVDLASADTTTDSDLTASLTSQSGGTFARLYTDSSKTTTLSLNTSVTALSPSGDNIDGRNLGTISQPNLDGFSFNWTTYKFTFTAPLTYWDDINSVQVSHSAGDVMTDISLDISNHVSGGGAFVADNFSLQAVPEPSSALLLTVVALFAATRRQRRVIA